jgi:acetyl esterase/lipase
MHEEVSPYAAPARAQDLSNLPPTFIDVGTCDLFRDEDIEFARRLSEYGNCEFHLYEGAFHASELIVPDAQISQKMWITRIAALRKAIE